MQRSEGHPPLVVRWPSDLLATGRPFTPSSKTRQSLAQLVARLIVQGQLPGLHLCPGRRLRSRSRYLSPCLPRSHGLPHPRQRSPSMPQMSSLIRHWYPLGPWAGFHQLAHGQVRHPHQNCSDSSNHLIGFHHIRPDQKNVCQR